MPEYSHMFRTCFALAVLTSSQLFAADRPPVDYSRDVRPILANSCFACHGPDEAQRKGKLRLDVREDAIKSAIVVGKGAMSPLVQRVRTTDREEVMPPPRAKKPVVTLEQAEILSRWIDEGAKYDQHWAYVKPVRVAVPMVKNAAWVRNPIDAFVAQGHERQKVQPAAEADRVTLIRRLSFDLLGLPPTMAEVDAFLNDSLPTAYEKMVDRLLASPHFGERLAVMWLDVVRYADTAGYHSDNHRDVWLFRDYVINSFNANKPFDRFTLEQIAGDLLPNATSETRIASGFNRMLQTTEEGGAQAKEYAAKYSADRVRNTSNAWLGATLGCAECHNHKYDPYTTRDFYRFAAFFADVQEKAVGRQTQTAMMTAEQEKESAKLDAEIARIEKELAKPAPELDKAQAAWEEEIKKKKDGTKGLAKPLTDAIALDATKRSAAQKQLVKDHFRTQVAAETSPLRKELAAVQATKTEFLKNIPTTLISMTGPVRQVRILPRGNWLDDSGELVTPGVPSFFGSLGTKDRATRLELAKWMVSPENSLTARVFVNRLWKIAFGQGLVKNLDDLGTQGAFPTHPELFDWLAVEFVEKGWDVKAIMKMMVMSNTYRQSSVAARDLRERDPGNAWLARQNRFRLDAEFVRDNALAIGGLLVPKIGGPSARPYQPAGFWSYLNFPKREWANDKGENQYRRGLYTYWCRSFLHPSLFAFDAPTREECTNERPRSSTPLQALVLLNDPTYVEASRAFAERLMKEGKGPTDERIAWMFRQAMTRNATVEEKAVLVGLYEKHLKEFRADKAGTDKLLGVGDRPLPKDVNAAELAAWTSVARVILNLHEVLTRN